MNEFFNKILNWVKGNMLIAGGLLLVLLILFFPKLFKQRTRRRKPRLVPVRRRRRTKSGKPLPRSVGIRRRRTKPRQYTKTGRVKKPWQIKGSIAAKRHMAKLRRMR